MTGWLRLVATPIGNLGDISPRAVETLATATVIACEDTRRTGALLRHLGVDRPRLVVVDDHREREVARDLVASVAAGERVALVSDAGMPGVSDPGYAVVGAAVEEGVAVEVVPGPSAALAALVVSGLATDRFVFEGFLPRKGSGRVARLADVAGERRTVVLFEAPHRLGRTLADLREVCGDDRRVAVARELTKLHEEVWRGTLAEAVAWTDASAPRGEIVVVVEGAAPVDVDDAAIVAALRAVLDGGASVRDAADEVAAALGVRRRRAYELALTLTP